MGLAGGGKRGRLDIVITPMEGDMRDVVVLLTAVASEWSKREWMELLSELSEKELDGVVSSLRTGAVAFEAKALVLLEANASPGQG